MQILAVNQITYRFSLILHFGHSLCDAVEKSGRHYLHLDCDCVVVQLATKNECDTEIVDELRQKIIVLRKHRKCELVPHVMKQVCENVVH